MRSLSGRSNRLVISTRCSPFGATLRTRRTRGGLRALVVERVLLVRCAQHDDALDRVRAREVAHAGEAVGIVDAHAEFDGAMIEHGHQPAAGVAAIEQQQIVWGEPVEMFEQELAFAALAAAVQGGGEHQVGPRQEQAEQDLVGKGGASNMAGAQAETQRRGVGGDQTQAAPAGHEAALLGAREQPVVETGNGGQR